MYRQQVAGSLLKEFKDQFRGNKFTGMLTYLAKQVSIGVRDKNPITRRQVDRQHLHDLEFYLNALEWREFRLLRMLVNRLRSNKQMNAFDQWNHSLDIALELARAHIDRDLLQEFINVIDRLESIHVDLISDKSIKGLRPMLRSLCSLYALTNIQSNMSFYMTFNYFSSIKSKAIYEEINRILLKLSDHSDALVNGFGIPEKFLGVIAGDWQHAFSYPNVPGYDVIPTTINTDRTTAKSKL